MVRGRFADRLEAFSAHPALRIGLHTLDPLGAEAEHPQRCEDRAVRLVADDDLDGRRAEESVAFDVPTSLLHRWCRAVARAVKFAICAPVTNPTLQFAGSPNSSSSHPATICSTTAAIGDMTNICAFWSQADTSQSAAVALGMLPPVTKPK